MIWRLLSTLAIHTHAMPHRAVAVTTGASVSTAGLTTVPSRKAIGPRVTGAAPLEEDEEEEDDDEVVEVEDEDDDDAVVLLELEDKIPFAALMAFAAAAKYWCSGLLMRTASEGGVNSDGFTDK